MRPAELHSRSAEENCPTENVASLRSVKVATPPCAAKAAIPCGLAVRKQHKMLFTASKFDINKFGGTYDKKNDDGIMYIRLYLYFSCVFWTTNKRTTYFAVLITYSPQNGLILLLMTFLISPMGIPLAAIWLLGKVQDFH